MEHQVLLLGGTLITIVIFLLAFFVILYVSERRDHIRTLENELSFYSNLEEILTKNTNAIILLEEKIEAQREWIIHVLQNKGGA